jgi:hypothetical protein
MVDNAISSAWNALTALCLPIEQLKKKYAVTLLHSANQHELCFGSRSSLLRIARRDNTIWAVMHKRDGRDLERIFSVKGGVEYPLLVEHGSSTPKRAFEVFEELMAWLRGLECGAFDSTGSDVVKF